MELEHLEKTFTEISNFPISVIKRGFKQIKDERREEIMVNDPHSTEIEEKVVRIVLPYAGKTGEML